MPRQESRPKAAEETAIVIDFGSQYSWLIARRIRECGVYSEVITHKTSAKKVAALNPKCFILSGGPASVYAEGAPLAPSYVFESGLPVLGICYGMQALAYQLGGQVTQAESHEYGLAMLHKDETDIPLFDKLPEAIPVWMSHGDRIIEMPPGFVSIAYTENAPIAAIANDQKIIGIQFHPEVAHTPQGKEILGNFLFKVCDFKGTWTPKNFVKQQMESIKRKVGNGKVICALSGGVDSTVVATLIHRAVGEQLTAIFVNNGLLRREEIERTLRTLRKNLKINGIYVDASDRFLKQLEGVIDPEEKRHIIGDEFIKVFEEEANKIGTVDFLAQGTLYPDVIESTATVSRESATIKTHHNVGGLPDVMKLKLIEPLRYLFKDEVREVGTALGLPEEMVWRQPFPGPGLAIRIIGDVTRERLEMLRAADWIVMNEIKKANLYRQLWQSFAVLTPLKSVGVMGDYRTYKYTVAIRAVTSEDAMTADWARLPYDLLARISNRIVNEVEGVNRVVYDICSKPPATIEWE
ncbi:MAG: glutamine-hydrolyzing GMP synthase [Chloroflexota bacterium]|nr:glutamine-hydrolyzing GMP synthase [Chloroflexota bacterium]